MIAYMTLATLALVFIPLLVTGGGSRVLVLHNTLLTVMTGALTIHATVAWYQRRMTALLSAVLYITVTAPVAICYTSLESEFNAEETRSRAHWAFFAAFVNICVFYAATFDTVTSSYVYGGIAVAPGLVAIIYEEVYPEKGLGMTGVIICMACVMSLAVSSAYRLRRAVLLVSMEQTDD
jgi:hypothetical protein